MRVDSSSRFAPLVAYLVLSTAVVGYFTGLQSPVTSTSFETNRAEQQSVEPRESSARDAIPATAYADIGQANRTHVGQEPTRLSSLKTNVDVLSEIKIDQSEKLFALQKRGLNRAFNGAPPTIPHPIDQKTTQACMACHERGAKTESLQIPRMSHQFLVHCTQCHVEAQPHGALPEPFVQNTFAGLAAPVEGPRAFAGAPPQMPHSTWMRTDCMSCHGPTGLHGLRTTHAWRKNCTQCHTPTAKLDQILLANEPKFLPAPQVEN